jgi:hypothetical protein
MFVYIPATTTINGAECECLHDEIFDLAFDSLQGKINLNEFFVLQIKRNEKTQLINELRGNRIVSSFTSYRNCRKSDFKQKRSKD